VSLLASNLAHIKQEILATQQQLADSTREVKIIAVSKRQPVEKIQAAIEAGQMDFAESYLREALVKKSQLKSAVQWHFIGRLQSNKITAIAENFDCVHSISSIPQAQALAAARPEGMSPLKCFVQVNIEQESTKAGGLPDALPLLLETVVNVKELNLLGLMSLPPFASAYAEQLRYCQSVVTLQGEMQALGFVLPELSLGTSSDYHAAVMAGSTMVRLGTCLFGERDNLI
jgi:PLP dependent protein